MVVDVQGVGDLYTDPQVGDSSVWTVMYFMLTHCCASRCTPKIRASETPILVSEEWLSSLCLSEEILSATCSSCLDFR